MIEKVSPDVFEPPKKVTLNSFFSLCFHLSKDGEEINEGYKENEFQLHDYRIINVSTLSRLSSKKLKEAPIVSVVIEELADPEEDADSSILKEINLFRDGSVYSYISLQLEGVARRPHKDLLEERASEVSEQELMEVITELRKIAENLYESDY